MQLIRHGNSVPVVLFISVWWLGAAESPCFLIMKENDRDIKIVSTDVTNEFSNGRTSPLSMAPEFKPLPEAPKNVAISQTSAHDLATLTWVQKQGFRSTLLKFYLMRLVKDKEVGGVPMRYTQYILHGPIPTLSGKPDVQFSYHCLNLTNTHKLSATIWSVGDMSSEPKLFWINKYSGVDITFIPDTVHDVRRKKHREAIEGCICQAEIYMTVEKTGHLTISIQNDRLAIPVDIHLVSKTGNVKQRMSKQTDSYMNKTDITLSRTITQKINKGFKLTVIKRCGSPYFRTRCGKTMADVFSTSNPTGDIKEIGSNRQPASDVLHATKNRHDVKNNEYQNDIKLQLHKPCRIKTKKERIKDKCYKMNRLKRRKIRRKKKIRRKGAKKKLRKKNRTKAKEGKRNRVNKKPRKKVRVRKRGQKKERVNRQDDLCHRT